MKTFRETKTQRVDHTKKIQSEECIVTLQPLAMRIPNKYGIYAPSKLRPLKKISYEEFLSRYADYPRALRVCFHEASSSQVLLEKSEWVTAYGFGLDCWYRIISTGNKDNPCQKSDFCVESLK
jgi:hypothetical protein